MSAAAETAAPSPVETARALAPEIAARADEIEAARRLPADLAATLAGAGLFRLIAPRAVGGPEAPMAEILAAIETVARADASTGWCMMIANTAALNAAYLPADLAREVFGDPKTIAGGVFAPMGRADAEGDHFRVTGRWKWASGSANCDWLVGGSMIFDDAELRKLPDGSPDHRMMIFPRDDVELIDTWHVAGLKGTGSGDMAVDGAIVPKDRCVSLIADRPHVEGPLYAFPAFGYLALGIAAVACGNARAALDDLKDLAAAKAPGGGRKTLAERATVQAEFARAEAGLRAARALLYESVDAAWEEACGAGEIGLETRAGLRLAATHMTRTAAETARVAYDIGGGTSVFLESPLQRRFRDAHVATQHMMIAPPTYELAGRALFGLPTDARTL